MVSRGRRAYRIGCVASCEESAIRSARGRSNGRDRGRGGSAALYTAYDLSRRNGCTNTARISWACSWKCWQCHDHPFIVGPNGDFWAMRPSSRVSAVAATCKWTRCPTGRQGIGRRCCPVLARRLRPATPLRARRHRFGHASRGNWASGLALGENAFVARVVVNRAWAICLVVAGGTGR